jgi:hypothetical protein
MYFWSACASSLLSLPRVIAAAPTPIGSISPEVDEILFRHLDGERTDFGCVSDRCHVDLRFWTSQVRSRSPRPSSQETRRRSNLDPLKGAGYGQRGSPIATNAIVDRLRRARACEIPRCLLSGFCRALPAVAGEVGLALAIDAVFHPPLGDDEERWWNFGDSTKIQKRVPCGPALGSACARSGCTRCRRSSS